MHIDGGYAQLCAAFSDDELEQVLSDYIWLATNSANSQASRISQLVAEAERRNLSEIVERARAKVVRRMNATG